MPLTVQQASGRPEAQFLCRRSILALVVGAAGAGVLSACATRMPSYRYRMTVEVETPEGLRSGSSVMEVGGFIESQFAPGEARGRSVQHVTGEAIRVEMPGGRMLFALMVSDRDPEYMTSAALTAAANEPWYSQKLSPNERRKLRDKFLSRPQQIPRSVDRARSQNADLFDNYPIFVTFGNTNDPQSIRRVNPDSLSAVFGSGVHLKRITVQLTRDPVTREMKEYLPWIDGAATIPFPPAFDAQFHTFGNYRSIFVLDGQ